MKWVKILLVLTLGPLWMIGCGDDDKDNPAGSDGGDGGSGGQGALLSDPNTVDISITRLSDPDWQDRITSDVFDHYSRDIKIVVDRSGEESLIRGVATAVFNTSMESG